MTTTTPTRTQVDGWQQDTLLEYLTPLFHDFEEHYQPFKKMEFNGRVFLKCAKSPKFFMDWTSLPLALIYSLVSAREEIMCETGKTAQQAELPQVSGPIFTNNPSLAKKMKPPPRGTVRRQKMIENAEMILAAIQKVPSKVDIYCNPLMVLTLPFPYAGPKSRDRFAFLQTNDGPVFQFYGRERFAEVYQTVDRLNRDIGFRHYFIHGTFGYGKSHIVAALVCLLIRQGRKVLYIPHCGGLLDNFFIYLRYGLVLTLAKDPDLLEELFEAQSEKDLIDLCLRIDNLYVVVDQLNVLELLPGPDLLDMQKKICLERVKQLSGDGIFIFSSSGNFQLGLQKRRRQANMEITSLFGGLTDPEMASWWERHGDQMPLSNLDADDRAYLEDQCGRIPYLMSALQRITVKPTLGKRQRIASLFEQFYEGPEVKWIAKVISIFYDEKKSEFTAQGEFGRIEGMNKFIDQCHSCLTNSALYDDENLDWKFSYESGGKGFMTCTIARKILARVYRPDADTAAFMGSRWTSWPSSLGNNPSVLGFYVEQIVLAHIVKNSSHLTGISFMSGQNRILKCAYFNERPEITGGLCLYIPRAWNYKAVDAILVSVNLRSAVRKAFIVGIQITIAKAHSNSEAAFFENWPHYEKDLSRYGLLPSQIEAKFLWIKERKPSKSVETVEKCHPTFTRITTSVEAISPDIGKLLSDCRGEAGWK